MRTKILAALCLGYFAAPAVAFDFSTSVGQNVDGTALMTVAGDVNGDQLDDVVIATGTGPLGPDPVNDFSLFVYLQQPNGTLSPPLKYVYGTGYGSGMDFVLADLNKDGVRDVVDCHDGGLTLLFASGAGFAKKTVAMGTASAPWGCRGLGVLDLNGDGNLDVVTQSASNSGGMTLFYGDGRGGFGSTASVPTPSKFYMDLQVGDVTGDGRADVVLVSDLDVDVYPSNGNNGFGPMQHHMVSNSGAAKAAAIGDFNYDGRNDVAVSLFANAPNAGVVLLTQTSNGVLGSQPLLPTNDLPGTMVATDLDRDGLTDLLVAHASIAMGLYLQGTTGLADEAFATQGSYYNGSHRGLDVADLNADGCTDAVTTSSNDGMDVLYGSGCLIRKARSDFNGDGKSDIVWRNAQTGANALWKSANSSTSQAVTAVIGLSWQIVGSGDFDGDGQADLIWHKTTDGTNAIWLAANSATTQPIARVTNLAWDIVGVGDFNGDRLDDVLWRNHTTGANAIWFDANAGVQLPVATLRDTHWKVAGVDDFDGDGRSDILWHNDASGASAIWPSGDYVAGRALTTVTDLHWQIAGTGDFDGDGKADVLWRNPATGSNTIWRTGNAATQMRIAAVAGGSWSVTVGDFGGDGKADLLWRDAATGVNILWRAAQLRVTAPVTDVTNTAWHVVP